MVTLPSLGSIMRSNRVWLSAWRRQLVEDVEDTRAALLAAMIVIVVASSVCTRRGAIIIIAPMIGAGAGRPAAAIVRARCIEQFLEFAAVEPDTATSRTNVELHAGSLDGLHGTIIIWT